MVLKIYNVGKNAWAIGVYDKTTGEWLRGGSPRYYRTKKGAQRALKKRLEKR